MAKATCVLVLVALFGVIAAGCSSGGSSGPPLNINGATQGQTFHDGQNVTVSMGPNKVFHPNIRLIIIECSDPGGTTANLPTKAAESCDTATKQGGTLIPTANSSFSWSGYTIYRLPSEKLGEAPTWVPECNATHYCVLYVGEDYNDFTMPKVFSHPFLVSGGST